MIPSRRLLESYRPVDDKNGVQAIRVEAADDKGQSLITWLTPNKPHILATRSGPMTLQLLTELAPSGGHP